MDLGKANQRNQLGNALLLNTNTRSLLHLLLSRVPEVRTVIEIARKGVGGAAVHYHEVVQGPHEAGLLLLESAKARSRLGYRSRWGLAEGVRRTLDWYQAQAAGDDARRLCEQDIREYSALP